MNNAAGTTDRRLLRGEESRRLILQATVDCVALEGLGQLTLDRVARRIGISRGLIVFHFKSKQQLIEEVLAYLGREYSSGWHAVLQRDDLDDAAKLVGLVEYDINFAFEHPRYVSAWHAFWGDSLGSQLFYELVVPRDLGYAADLSALLARLARPLDYTDEDLEAITQGLMVMMFGIWTQLHLNKHPGDFAINARAVRLYLQKMFPQAEFPEFQARKPPL